MRDNIQGGNVMSKALSIIVPVYNKSQFLQQCVSSIDELKLNHDEIEAIFVDDVSTDDSLEQLKQFEQTVITCVL